MSEQRRAFADRPGDEAALPLSRPRSAVQWPHRHILLAADREPVSRLLRHPKEQHVPRVAAAVTAVLMRYCEADPVPVGIIAADGTVCRAELLRSDAGMGALAGRIRDILRSGRMCGERDIPAVLVSVQEDETAPPDLGQDATVILRAAEAALACSYNPRLFDEDVVQRFLAHVLFFIDLGLRDESAAAAELEYLRPDELATVEAATCPPPTPYPSDATVQGLFAAAVRNAPDAVAVEFGDENLSYRELDVRTDRVAAGLVACGVTRGAPVGVSIRPSVDQIVALLGVLKAGATPVPIDYTFPRLRLEAIVQASGLDVLVTESGLADSHSGLARLILLDDLERNEPPPANVEAHADDLVYVLFTSGSTGAPKGVAMRQRTLVNLVCWQNACTPAAGTRTLNRSSMAFDVGFQEIFATVCWGGTLVVASEAERADIARLQQLIGQQRIERVFLPPVALVQLAELSVEPGEFTALRNVIVAGEQLRITPAIVRLFRSCAATLTNQYGPTETHVATSYDLQGSSLKWPLHPPIGRPIANARVHVIDSNGQRCPIGVAGEIVIGGALPAVGYLGNPEATAQRFVPDRFPGAAPHAVMYRTGDVGRLLSDGTIEFIGRRDDQIKLRGYRIELSDIEANATAIPGVQIAAATVKTRRNADAFIALFLQMQPGFTLDVRAVRNFLLERLPQHMVPALGAIRALEQLPLNRNGKIDRARLPDFEIGGSENDATDSQSPGERVATIWKRCLHVDAVEPDDDFAALGGHSLIAIQIVSRVNDAFGISVPMASLLRGGSLRTFSAKVAELIAATHGTPAIAPPSKAASALAESASVTLADGRVVAAPYAAEAHHFYREVFERKVYLRHGISVPSDGTVLDVGANIGLFALYVLDQFGDARVIAIEPAPALVSALKRNTAALSRRIRIFEVGLGARDGSAAFTFYPALTGMSSFFPDQSRDRQLLAGLIAKERASNPAVNDAIGGDEAEYLDSRLAAQTLERPMRRLSSLVRPLGLNRIDLLKIDVQHGEDEILDGIDAEDWPKVRQIVVEYQNGNGADNGIVARLAAKGFETITEQDAMHSGTDVVYTYAVRPS